MSVLNEWKRKYLESEFRVITEYTLNKWYGMRYAIRDPETAEKFRKDPLGFINEKLYIGDIGLGNECILADRVEIVRKERDYALEQLLSYSP